MIGPEREQPQSEINTDESSLLLDLISDIRNLRGTIQRQKLRGSILVRSCSAGKPWYELDDYVSRNELSRVRVVERWLNPNAPVPHGLVLIMKQSIYPRSIDSQDATVGIRGTTVIFGDSTDERVNVFTKLRFRTNGTVTGVQLLRADTPNPNIGGMGLRHRDALIDFYLQQHDLEQDYRHSPVTTDDVARLNLELCEFIEEEQLFGKLRSVLSETM